jgi:hypothetical protein
MKSRQVVGARQTILIQPTPRFTGAPEGLFFALEPGGCIVTPQARVTAALEDHAREIRNRDCAG